MAKFRIPKTPLTSTKSIRFPNDVIEEVEKAIRGKDCTFTAFVVEATRVALENLKEEEAAIEGQAAETRELENLRRDANGNV